MQYYPRQGCYNVRYRYCLWPIFGSLSRNSTSHYLQWRICLSQNDSVLFSFLIGIFFVVCSTTDWFISFFDILIYLVDPLTYMNSINIMVRWLSTADITNQKVIKSITIIKICTMNSQIKRHPSRVVFRILLRCRRMRWPIVLWMIPTRSVLLDHRRGHCF